jgi:Janus/Ocnus family (Ocnus)
MEVLFKNTNPTTTLTFIRGDKSCEYHANILEKFIESEIKPSGLTYLGNSIFSQVQVSCPGGGRMTYEPQNKSLAVYGYSMGFGQYDHNKAVEIMKMTLDLPDDGYKVSFEGY